MLYADSVKYGEDIAEVASSKIDDLTFNRIIHRGFENLTEYQQEQVKKASNAQAQYYMDYGIDSGQVNSISVGSFSMALGGSNGGSAYDGASPTAIMYLKPTGLMIRRV